jgi:aryl-alcohol dehydrogenase-like predicted oxidoreductase
MWWGYGKGDYTDTDIQEAFATCIEAGVTMFDTAEVYGMGKSESILGQLVRNTDKNVLVATKFMPFPWRLSRKVLQRCLKNSLKRLGLDHVDLYQIHWPYPPITVETWMEAMLDVYQDGLIKAVGVSNYNLEQTRRAVEALTKQGVNLASNQVEYHLLNRTIEQNGLLEQCKRMGVRVIAYSPLAMGVLSGKYTPNNPPQGIRGGVYNRKRLATIQPLMDLLMNIGSAHAGKSPAQVALNWIICKGALPIPGVKSKKQAEANLGALGWRLLDEEVVQLDEMSDHVHGK